MTTIATPLSGPVVVPGSRQRASAGPVVVALDDDGNARTLLRHGRHLAARLRVPLRAAYVWSDCRPPECAHHRRCHRDLGEACRLLTALIDDHLPADAAGQVERDVVHAVDPAAALVTLSASASMLVVGSSSDCPRDSAELGGTTRRLLGRTRCPVMVVPRATGPRNRFW
ncbi:universal stress protein [Actinoplanes sp. KI2]|uniref:universal stress protein n=1 Tax=Actinoplanes sp. KI2 TaxID=2983315 RepID=UPI0021D5C03B|nr:universal stress protein [Actinoplanes sp. KI2]MCU7730998.1 universal stress protein [Actinoplanes sp. KI2]